MLAKLTIGNPRLIFFVDFKGKRVDQDRLSFVKLHIIGARIFQNHIECKRLLLDFYQRERRILYLIEAPFIRVGNKRKQFRLNYFVIMVKVFAG
ncbi:hypothetical protein JCM15764A_31950 [Geotalea toluenoxydans]